MKQLIALITGVLLINLLWIGAVTVGVCFLVKWIFNL